MSRMTWNMRLALRKKRVLAEISRIKKKQDETRKKFVEWYQLFLAHLAEYEQFLRRKVTEHKDAKKSYRLAISKCKRELKTLKKKREREKIGIECALAHNKSMCSWAQGDLKEYSRELKRIQKIRRAKQNISREKMLLELKKITRLPLVAAVKVSDSKLLVYTLPIYILHNGGKFEIGIFVIRICHCVDFFRNPFLSNIFELENLCTTHLRGSHHPYMSDYDLDFCFGEQKTLIIRFLNQLEFSIGLQCILGALTTAEGDHPDAVYEWKEVKSARKKCKDQKLKLKREYLEYNGGGDW